MLTITYGYLQDFLEDPIYYGAYFTGSRAFGVNMDDSDYDYIITYNDWDNINSEIKRIYFDTNYEGGAFKSVHFKYNDKIYNILVMCSEEFKCWRWTTKMFLFLINKNNSFKKIISIKNVRVNLFEAFKDAHRGCFDIPF